MNRPEIFRPAGKTFCFARANSRDALGGKTDLIPWLFGNVASRIDRRARDIVVRDERSQTGSVASLCRAKPIGPTWIDQSNPTACVWFNFDRLGPS
jgi:hypothetical protein